MFTEMLSNSTSIVGASTWHNYRPYSYLSRRGVNDVPVTIMCQLIVTHYRIMHIKHQTFLEWMLKPWSRFLLQRLKLIRLQEITRILRNPNFRYRFHNRPLFVPILSHINPLHAHPSHSLKIDFSIFLPSTPRSSRQSPSSTLAHLYLPDCWLEVSIRKVLRPAISTQVFLGFPVPKSKCWDGSQDSKLPLSASHVALPTKI